jgi:hypothetical protein
MTSKPRTPWARRRRRLGALAMAGFLAANAIACMQARALLHYGPAGQNTPGIEQLTAGEKLRTILLGAASSMWRASATSRSAWPIRRPGSARSGAFC